MKKKKVKDYTHPREGTETEDAAYDALSEADYTHPREGTETRKLNREAGM